MPETTVELSNNNDLFGNLFTRTRSTTNNSNPPVIGINSIKPETGDEDSTITETIPFQEMLGQHITNLTVQDTIDRQKANSPSSESCTSELLQGHTKEMNPSISHELLMIDYSQRNGNNHNTSPSLKGEFDGSFSSTRGSGAGFEWVFPGKQTSNTIHAADISSGTFAEQQEQSIQNSDQNSFLENGVAGERELREIDKRQNKQFINTTSSGFSFHTGIPLLQNLTVGNDLSNSDNVGLNPSDTMENRQKFDLSTFSTVREPAFANADIDTINVRKLQHLEHPVSHKTQEPTFTGSDLAMGNIRELPEAFQLSFPTAFTDKKHTPFIPEIIDPINTTERPMENDLLKINGVASSKQDILNIQQANAEWNLSDNPDQKQNTFVSTPFGIYTQKTDGKYPFSVDTQTTAGEMQSNSTNFQQNATIFSGNSTAQPSSIEVHKDTVLHTFHRSFTAGTEYTHNNIIEQLFQKISLVQHGDRSEIKLHLTPPELGSVKIHFTEENDEIEAKIFVENAEVKAVIENHAHRLKESVAANGMEIHRLEVYIQNDNAQKQNLSEDPDTNDPHYLTNSQERESQDHSVNESNMSNNMQTNTGIKTSNLMIDYVI